MAKVILEFDSIEELNAVFSQARRKFESESESKPERKGIIPTEIGDKRGEVNGHIFEQLMRERGYKVHKMETKKARCKEFGIHMIKRGKEWRYRVSDIEKAPKRRIG
jgi:uncharacterized protein (DUF111 family)